MSGQKDIQVNAVAEQLRNEQLQRQAELTSQRRERQTELDHCTTQMAAAEQKLQHINTQRAQLQHQVQGYTNQVEQLVSQERELKRRLKNMEQRVIDAKHEVEDLGRRIQEDVTSLHHQLQQVQRLKAATQSELDQFERELAKLNGSEGVEAIQNITQLEQEQQQILANLGAVQVQLDAFASDTTLGIVLDQLMQAATDLGYQVTRTFAHKDDVELYVSNAVGETIRIALALAAQQGEPPTKDERLHMVLQGQGHTTNQVCLADTVKILERLKARGVSVTLKVTEQTGSTAERARESAHSLHQERNSYADPS